MKLALALVFILVLAGPALAQTMEEYMEGEEVESSYNIQTVVTRENAYIILVTEKPGSCEYGLEEFDFGEGTNFEEINGTLHRAKIGMEEGKSYTFKIKCRVEGNTAEENIIFSVSHISFFLLEKLEGLRLDLRDFRLETVEYAKKVNVDSLNARLVELEETIKEAEKSITANDIDELRQDISEGLRKKDEIEGLLAVKSLQVSILESSKYIVILIIVVFLILYFVTSLVVPYFSLENNIKSLERKEKDMTRLRQNTETLYFRRKIDEDTFNKMVVKEQEEVMRLRAKIANMKDRKKTLMKEAFSVQNAIDWSLKEKIHLRDWLRKKWERIKGMKYKINNK